MENKATGMSSPSNNRKQSHNPSEAHKENVINV
jgi:hypothetical protein